MCCYTTRGFYELRCALRTPSFEGDIQIGYSYERQIPVYTQSGYPNATSGLAQSFGLAPQIFPRLVRDGAFGVVGELQLRRTLRIQTGRESLPDTAPPGFGPLCTTFNTSSSCYPCNTADGRFYTVCGAVSSNNDELFRAFNEAHYRAWLVT